jgi:hypothetical protein
MRKVFAAESARDLEGGEAAGLTERLSRTGWESDRNAPKRTSDVDRLQGDISLSTRRRPANPQGLAAAWAGLQTGKGGEAPPRPTSCALEDTQAT